MKYTFVASSLLVLIAGCRRSEPSSYEVPKEPVAAASQPASPSMMAGSMGSETDMQLVQEAHASMMKNAAAPAFKATLPEGWSEVPGSGMRMVSYTIPGTSIDFYMIPLSMGDVTSNVNRWRGQVGLPEASAEELADQVQTLTVDGHAVNYVEIYNAESGRGIIAAIFDLAPSYWYFTAKGSVDELKANAEEIRKVIESIKIN